MFDHFVGLVLKVLNTVFPTILEILEIQLKSFVMEPLDHGYFLRNFPKLSEQLILQKSNGQQILRLFCVFQRSLYESLLRYFELQPQSWHFCTVYIL